MRRRANIQHGQKRRMPWPIAAPIVAICVLLPVLGWQLDTFFGGT